MIALKNSTDLTQKYARAAETSDLRRDLEIIVGYAEGNAPDSATLENLDQAVNTVLVLLFFNPILDEIRIPMSFHQTPLGRIINQARSRLIWLGDALNITEASKDLNVSRRTIYDWIELGRLAPIWIRDQPLIPRIQLAVLSGYVGRNLHQIAEALRTIQDPMTQRALRMLNDPQIKKAMEEAMEQLNDPALKQALDFPNTPVGKEALGFPNSPAGEKALRYLTDPLARKSIDQGMQVLNDPIVKQMQRALKDPLVRQMIQMGRDPLFRRAAENAFKEPQANMEEEASSAKKDDENAEKNV